MSESLVLNEPRIAILGTVEVIGSGRTTSLPGLNLPTLLSLLALTPGRAVSNERLIASLWPDADPVKSTRSLISLVHQLNVVLGAHLGLQKAVGSVKGVGRVLRVDAGMIDLVRFERHIAAADEHLATDRTADAIDEYAAALDLWRGDPFGGVDVRALVEPCSRLRIARQGAEDALIDASLRLGRGPGLVPWLLQRVDADPFDERIASDAARSLYQAGRSSDALDVLRACMDHQRQRGVEPAAATRQLELDVLDHSLDSDRELSRTSSRPDDTLIGRRAECAALDAWHAGTPGSSVMAISGQAGIGKTALLNAWTHQLDDAEVITLGQLFDASGDAGQAFSSADGARHGPHAKFDAVVQLISAAPAPVLVLVIDDAQGMTVAGVALLRHVLWHANIERLHVVAAVRTPDIADNAALSQLLNDATREGRGHELELGAFDLDEMRQLVSLRAATRTTDAIELVRLTGGNPMFAIGVIESGDANDERSVPAAAQSALGRFLTPLCDRSRTILEAAARLGVEGDAAHLAADVAATELDVMDALDDVGRGRLLNVDPIGGTYRFVHELARRAVLVAQADRGPA